MPEDNFYPEIEEEDQSEPAGNQDDMGETSLLPASFFQGKDLEPGTRCEIEIVKVYGDEVEVRYVPHSSEDEEDSGEPEMEVMIGMEDE